MIPNKQIQGAIQSFIDRGEMPNLLFYGKSGTGKTSTIMAASKQLYQKNYKWMVLELNASDDRGIGFVRGQIKNFARTNSPFHVPGSFKLVILDECDAMTNDAQAALRRLMEKYSERTRFCLICNHSQKIIQALQSRCMKFRFFKLQPKLISSKLKEIAD